jgi:hypothetical protein
MENVRVIYEQIEEAKRQLTAGSLLRLRLALILLDNAAELMMYRELEHEFAWCDQIMPKWEPARTEWLAHDSGPKYTAEERRDAEKEFDPKARILALRLRRITADERDILSVCHKFRCEAFHRGHLRREILLPVCKLLYLTVAALTVKLWPRSYQLPSPNPHPDDAGFLARFGIVNALSLTTEEGREQLRRVLVEDIVLDVAEQCQVLSADLTERIQNTIANLAYLGDTEDDRTIDHNLQYTQFWREQGAELARERLRESDLKKAFENWRIAGKARYTLAKMRFWLRRAEHISRRKNPARAIVDYWALEKRFGAFEEEVSEAVVEYEDRIDAESQHILSVIAEQVEEAMLGRRRTLDTTRAERDNEPVKRQSMFREARDAKIAISCSARTC